MKKLNLFIYNSIKIFNHYFKVSFVILLLLTSCNTKSEKEVKGTFVETPNITAPSNNLVEFFYNQLQYNLDTTTETIEPIEDTTEILTKPMYIKLNEQIIYENLEEAKELAMAGDIRASEHLAKYENRAYWSSIGADNGSAISMYNLGELYENGIDLPIDYEKALHYYNKSSKENYGEAYYKLGYFYLNGIGVDAYYYLAYDYLYRGSGIGSSNAMILLGTMFEKGLGVDQNYNTAVKWYQLSNTPTNKLTNLLSTNKKDISIIDTDKVSYVASGSYGNQIIEQKFVNIVKNHIIENNFDKLFETYKSDYGLKENLVEVNGKYQDGYYFDIDKDEIKEILSPIGKEMVVLKSIDGNYEEIHRFNIIPEKSGLIRYNNNFYYLTKTNESYTNRPTSATIYAFGEKGVMETCKIIQEPTTTKRQYQKVTGEDHLDKYMEIILNNYKNRTMDSGILYSDLDNNGHLEKVQLGKITVKDIDNLAIDIYGYNNINNNTIENFLKKIRYNNNIGYLTQLYIENINGLNYVFLLYEGYNTYLFSYLLDDNVDMVSNYIGYNLYNTKVEFEKH